MLRGESRLPVDHDDRGLLAVRSGILFAPPVRDIHAARGPDVRMRARVPHEIAKDLGAKRAAGQEWVHGNAHDLRAGRAFVVRVVELIDQQAVARIVALDKFDADPRRFHARPSVFAIQSPESGRNL